jgi:hypothetical protein
VPAIKIWIWIVGGEERGVDIEKEEKQAVWRLVIGVGFWVQRFWLFPWLGINFFLKDGMVPVEPPGLCQPAHGREAPSRPPL